MFNFTNICKTEQIIKKFEKCECIIESICAAENKILVNDISSDFQNHI